MIFRPDNLSEPITGEKLGLGNEVDKTALMSSDEETFQESTDEVIDHINTVPSMLPSTPNRFDKDQFWSEETANPFSEDRLEDLSLSSPSAL